jgi:hypothetical protein
MTHHQMNTETIVSPVAETQNPAPEIAEQTTEVAIPETPEEAPELTDAERHAKTVKAMERRLNRKHAQAAQAEERARMLEERLARLETPATKDEPAVDENAIREKAREIARLERITEQSNEVYSKGKQKFTDFDDAIKAVIAETGPLIDSKGFPTAIGQVVLESDNPHVLLHHLGNNPDLAADLADLTPTQVARRIARIEAEMTAKPKTSAAPKPLGTVKPAAVTNDLSSDLDTAEWMRRREKQLRERHS